MASNRIQIKYGFASIKTIIYGRFPGIPRILSRALYCFSRAFQDKIDRAFPFGHQISTMEKRIAYSR